MPLDINIAWMVLQAMLSRFTNATAISSADFYGDSSNHGGGRALTDLDFTASELIGKISVQVIGDRALEAQYFCVFMWS